MLQERERPADTAVSSLFRPRCLSHPVSSTGALQVTQLAKASMSSRGGEQLIKFETWLDWLYRAATHGFSKPPFGRCISLSHWLTGSLRRVWALADGVWVWMVQALVEGWKRKFVQLTETERERVVEAW